MKQYDFIKDPDTGDITVSDFRKRKLDIVPRIICVVFAIIIWIYFVNINDSSVTATFKVKLDVVGADELKNNSGQMLYGLDTQEVTITVKGTNRDLKKFSATDYIASIDVASISGSGKHTMEISPMLPGGNGLSLSVVSVEPQIATFYTDTILTKTVSFEAVKGGEVTTPYTASVISDKNTVDISGPKSMVEKIELARYSVKGGDYHTSTKFSGFKLSFFDISGNSVPYDENMVTYSTDDVTVELKITTESKMEIALLMDGAPLKGVACMYDPVTVMGDPTVILSDIVKNSKINVDVTMADINNGKKIVRITDKDLPEGVMLKEEYIDVEIKFTVLEE